MGWFSRKDISVAELIVLCVTVFYKRKGRPLREKPQATFNAWYPLLPENLSSRLDGAIAIHVS